MDQVDVLVVGAGVVGLAIAREFAMAGREVIVIERESHYGTGTSARNSGVIHAGIYYPTGSLKARWCVRGRQLLYDYAAARGVGHQRIGKLIVARHRESARLHQLYETGRANGVDDLAMISGAQARELEPAIDCDLAIHSPSTGIVDAHELMHALLGDAEHHGAVLAVDSRFQRAESVSGVWQVEVTPGPTVIGCNVLINAAGLDAQGDNLFLATTASGAAVTGTPASPGFGSVLQGFVETSNVNVVAEITNLITAQRAYEMNSKVITTSDQMLSTLTNLR